MYSFPYLEPVCCSTSSSNCCLLTSIQISQETGKVVWYSHLLKNFPQFLVIHIVKGFGIVNKAEVVFWGSKIPADGDGSHEIKRHLLLRRKVMTNLDSIFKSRDITLPTKVHPVKAMIFPVVMYGCENWTMKKAECRRIDAFDLWCWWRLLSPLDCKEIQPVHPKGDQSWVFIGRTDAEAETPTLWSPHVNSWLIGKDPDAGRD